MLDRFYDCFISKLKKMTEDEELLHLGRAADDIDIGGSRLLRMSRLRHRDFEHAVDNLFRPDLLTTEGALLSKLKIGVTPLIARIGL